MGDVSAADKRIEDRPRWSLRLFGGFELIDLCGGGKLALPRKRDRALLSYLAVTPNGRASRRKLAVLLWGETTDAAALDNLRVGIWSLRKSLGDKRHTVIVSDGDEIALDAMAFDIDVLTFRGLVAESGTAELEQAAEVYSGEFLDGFGIESAEFESWRREEAMRSRDQALDVFNRLMKQWCESGETERAIVVGTKILQLEPMHETAVRRLMRLYGESGRRGAAIRLYHTLNEILETELNAEPEGETRAVLAEISRGGERQLESSPAAGAGTHANSPPPPSMPIARLRERSSPELVPCPRQSSAPAVLASPQAKRTTLNWILAGGLAAIMAILVIHQLASSTRITTSQQPTGIEAAKPASFSQAAGISIAVLPFANMSGDPTQEFFSDGMTEEITAVLSKIPDLHVVARTSAFQFKGEKKDMRAVGQALGATYLIEGSVRQAGDRMRITVQLIKANSGVHVWTETYDRQQTNIFAIQENIAEAIAVSLRVPLGLKPGETLVSLRPKDEETYELFLRGRAAFRARRVGEAIALLDQVVARDPNFASGWRFLAAARDQPNFPGKGQEARTHPESQETLARRVIALAPGSAAGYQMLANLAEEEGKRLETLAFLEQALARDPDDPEVLNGYRIRLWTLGYLKEALAASERLHVIEPLIPIYNFLRADVLGANGMLDMAVRAVRDSLAASPDSPAARRTLVVSYAQLARFNDAMALLLPESAAAAFPQDQLNAAVQVLRAAANRTAPPARLPDFGRELWWVYAYTPTPERMLDVFEKAAKQDQALRRYVWWPMPSSLRKTERFKTLVRNSGLVDVWRARGWPDLCHPVSADDFTCD